MNKKAVINTIFLTLLGASGSSYAEKTQDCDNATILLLAEKLKLKGIEEDVNDSSNSDAVKLDGVSSSACKANPQNKELQYVVLASNQRDDKNGQSIHDLTIAIVNKKNKKIVSSYKDIIEEDATLRIEQGTLWIDTANYQLNENTRAFGIEMRSSYSPNCGDGGLGSTRTLYIQQGNKIRPILKDLIMSDWHYVVEGLSRCNSTSDESEETIIESRELSLSMADTKTNGFKDIILSMKRKITDGSDKELSINDKTVKAALLKNSLLKPYTIKVSYDGNMYPFKN
jgi:hypothetical protein